MSPAPILDAMHILRTAIYQALDPLTSAGVYWLQAQQSITLPYVIFQSQDGGGSSVKRIGDHGWSGLVTVRALATSQSAAEALYTTVAPGMDGLSYVGYTIGVEFDRPLTIPPDVSGTWQTGGIWRVTIN